MGSEAYRGSSCVVEEEGRAIVRSSWLVTRLEVLVDMARREEFADWVNRCLHLQGRRDARRDRLHHEEVTRFPADADT